MSDDERVEIEKIDSSHQELLERFYFAVDLLRPQPQIFESTTPSSGRIRFAIALPVRFEKESPEQSIGIVAERQELLELGRHIVLAFEPSPEDHILSELKGIRKLLEDQRRS